MTEHISDTALEHYLLGDDTLDSAVLETHLLACEPCAQRVREQLELESALGQVAAAAKFCPGCGRVLAGDRCDQCGATAVAGGYRIERVLVKTTHGRLYAAFDGHGNRVALKELAFVQAPTLETLAAFDRETKFLRALSHPCIPKFHASFIEGTGIHTRMYIAQDLVEGESLLARMQTHWFDEREVISIARAVLEILIYLQSLSPMVFHRDIKPANLIARPDGSIALVDFGAARDVSETMGNTAVGTFGYMPMEQMAGIYDATTDLYALGASLFHLLTRREPWKLLDGGGTGVNVSPDLRLYLDKLMARRPEDRFPNARAALDGLLARRPLPPTRNKRKLLAIGMFALCGTGVAVGTAIGLQDRDGGSGEHAQTFAAMERFADQMCRCPDRACVDRTNAEHTQWGLEVARSRKLQLDPADGAAAQRSREIMARYTTCMTEKMLNASRPAREGRGEVVVTARALDWVSGPDRTVGTFRTCKVSERLPDTNRCPNGSAQLTLPRDAFVAFEELAARKPEVAARLRATIDTLTRTADRILVGQLVGPPGDIRTAAHGTFADGYFALDAKHSPHVIEVAGYEHVIVHGPQGGQIEWTGTQTLTPSGEYGTLNVTSTPKAQIRIDGIDTGLSTPAKIRLAPGRHKIMFVYGTTRSSFPVIIKANETLTMVKELE